MPRHPWSELRDPIMADPMRRAQIEETGRATDVVLAIAKLVDAACETAAEPVPTGSEPNVPRIAEADSDYLATLKDGTERLGGRLEIAAVFSDRRIPLLDDAAASRSDALPAQSSREE